MPILLPHSEGSSTAGRPTPDIGHWRRTIARQIWLLRHAGIAALEIEREVERSLRQCHAIEELPVPTAHERWVARILAHWRHESAFLDDKGQPRALPFDGRGRTFRSLVRAAVPGADTSTVLGALQRYHLVTRTHAGLRLMAEDFPRYAEQRGPILQAALLALEALTDTCCSELRARRHSTTLSRIPRMIYTEYLDPRAHQDYDEFLNESTQVFLMMHESWLKRHEIKTIDPGRKILRRMGVGLFGIRDP